MNILLNSEPISISENFFSSYTLLNSYLNLPIGKFIKKNNHRCLITERAFFQGENIINSIKKITFLEKIFSLKNKGIYKVLRILGFKFEFRRKLK